MLTLARTRIRNSKRLRCGTPHEGIAKGQAAEAGREQIRLCRTGGRGRSRSPETLNVAEAYVFAIRVNSRFSR